MPFSVAHHQGRRILKLEGAVTIQHAQDLAARLGDILDHATSIEVDTGDLEDIDTCILQVLCSLGKAIPEISFDEPSDVFIRALDRCGMRREILGTRAIL